MQNGSAAFTLSVVSSLARLAQPACCCQWFTQPQSSSQPVMLSYPTACPSSQRPHSLASSQGPALPSSSLPRQHLHCLCLRQDCSSQNQDLKPPRDAEQGTKPWTWRTLQPWAPRQDTTLQDSIASPLPTQEHKLPAGHTAPGPLPKA